MATLRSCATGNFTTNTTWNLCNATSLLDSETGTTGVTSMPTNSSNFTPGAITINALAVKLSSRSASPSGTFTIVLRNTTGGSDVANTNTTVNVADLPANGGWVFFPTNGSVLLLAATNYAVRCSTSVATGQVTLYRDSTGANWTRQLSTTTNQVPVANDILIIAGDHTGAGTGNSYTVTMNETATTSYGTTTPPNSISVNKRSTLAYGVVAATNYYLKYKGTMKVWDGGTFTIGTSGSPMPSNSTAVLEMASVANVDTGLVIANGGTFNTYGNALTVDRALLAANEGGLCNTSGTTVTRIEGDGFTGMVGNIIINGTTYTISSVTNDNVLVLTATAGTQTFSTYVLASTTSLTTDVSTGWLNGDLLQIATTNKFISAAKTAENERVSLTANAVGTGLTTSALVYGHMGVAPTQAEIANLTRNVKIRGMSTSLSGYVYLGATANISSYWTEYSLLGSATAGKRSIEVATTTGTADFQRCSFYDMNTGTNMGSGIWQAASPTGGLTITNNVFANMNYVAIYTYGTHTGTNTYSGNLVIKTVYGIEVYDNSDTITNNVFAGCQSRGIYFGEEGGAFGTISGNTIHSSGYGILIGASPTGGTILNTTAWRNAQGISPQDDGSNYVIDTATLFGNETAQLYIGGRHLYCLIKNVTANAGTGIVGQYGVINFIDIGDTVIADSSFGNTTAFSLANFYGNNNTLIRSIFHNVTWGAGTLIADGTVDYESSVSFQRFNGVAGDHRTYTGYGVKQTDTTIFKTASPSLRMTPSSATFKLKSTTFKAAVASGSTVTPSIWVRESVAGNGTDYNGNRIRLIVKANPATGITSDTVLDTATVSSEGDWEELTGTTAAVSEDCVLEFCVDCDGTTGWVNIDDFTCATKNDSKGYKYWLNGEPYVVGDNGGGGGSFTFA
jgi:parallel beta-helix repeat protein